MGSYDYDYDSSNSSYSSSSYNSSYSNSYNSNYDQDFEQTQRIVGTYLVVVYIASLVSLVLLIVAMWKIFSKAGEEGWKSLVPLYNSYTLFKISWKGKYFWILFAISVAYPISLIIPFLPLLLFIAILVIDIRQNYLLARSFGKGIGFTVGLILLTPIFYLILAFSSSAKYVGNGFEIVEKEKALNKNVDAQVV